MAKERIGILGTGDVGRRLGGGFARLGHEVMMGSRDPKKEEVVAWQKETGPLARAGTLAEAARFGEVVVLATSWSGTENALRLAGPENMRGKVVLDVTNPLVFRDEEGPPELALGHTDSGGEQVQRWLPGARVVKTLNIVTNATMVDPGMTPGGKPTMFVAGDDADAKATARRLLEAFGWDDVIDIGGIEGARLMEPITILWVRYGFMTNKWHHAFKLLR